MIPMPKSLEELQVIAKRVRREIVEMIGAAGSGHPGGSLSAVEIVVELYFNTMRIDPKNPKWPHRDRFILSKGHAAPVLYAVMAEAGYAERQWTNSTRCASWARSTRAIRTCASSPRSKPPPGRWARVFRSRSEWARRAAGRQPSRTYCMLGRWRDPGGPGLGSGHGRRRSTSWITSAAIVDYNGIQLDGFVKDIMEVAPLAEKWRAFGWHTIEIDGHDPAAVRAAFEEAAATKGKPTCLVAHTIKGKGVSFMENNPKFHGTAPTPAEVKLALQELQ